VGPVIQFTAVIGVTGLATLRYSPKSVFIDPEGARCQPTRLSARVARPASLLSPFVHRSF
jgi:hypothetical protein